MSNLQTMFKKLDGAGISDVAMVNVLSRYKRDRKHVIRSHYRGLLSWVEFKDKVDHLDLCIATMKVLLNRAATQSQGKR